MLAWLLSHHLAALLSALLTLLFAGSVLDRRRPVGSAFAWLFAIAFVPLIAVPLYLVFGGRKFARRVAAKPKLDAPAPLSQAHATACDLHWLDDGVAAYTAFLGEVRTAEASIRIVTFVLGDDPTGRGIVAALTEAAARGVQVHLLLDDLLFFHAPKRALAGLRAAGARVERFMPLLHVPFRGRANLRNHRKIALFDGARAIVGGMNLADAYMGPAPAPTRFRDLALLLAGPAVDELDRVFRADFAFATGTPLAPARTAAAQPRRHGSAPVRVIPSGPDVLSDPIYDALLTAIFRADERVWVATPYFVPDDGLLRALEVAVRRGIDVRVLVPARSNHRLADVVAAPVLRALAAEGVRVYRYGHGMMHGKAVLIDQHLAMVGSANFDMRSLWIDFEIALFLSGEPEVRWLSGWYERLAARCDAGAPEAGVVRASVEHVARLFSPLL